MKKHFIYAVATIIFLGIISSAVVQAGETEKLTEAAVQEIKDMAMPYTINYTVTYDPESNHVIVSFETGREFKYNYNQYYLLWWDCQWVTLNAFAKRGISVKTVAVYTNLEDASGQMLMATKSEYIRKYANSTFGMTRWLDLTDSFLWDEEKQTWRPVGK